MPASSATAINSTDPKGAAMWYFTWILGLGFALLLGLCNLLWLEARWEADERDEPRSQP
ncbi:hypothetical protein KBAD04_13630 [Aeromonas dhakensis]|nr:hypothetical protein VAWG003_26060 [Aeromonas dhakensis]BEE26680.1 hypothetical protein VAWG005_26080 [Aeromonas dhakensis]CAD7515225.1 hypothetical protein KBAD04_13630 [Aeromonas dhakensis]